MVEVAIITAPRQQPTIGQSIKALRYGGHDGVIHVFAEPGSVDPGQDGVEWHQNEETLGCFGNYHHALSWLVENKTGPYVAVLSDDFTYKRNCFKQMPLPQRTMGYLALYTPTGMRSMIGRRRGELTVVNRGWGNAWGGLYVFEIDVARKILAHKFYQEHLENYEANQQIDHCIPEVCHRLNLNQYYPNPSLAQHIGNTSTIGHTHTQNERGLNFSKN